MSNDKCYAINLEDYRAKDSKVFTGRDRGKAVREASKIDEMEKVFSEINIIIPDNIYSINPSFFEELFLNVVTSLGKDNFLKKFKFTSLGSYAYSKPLNEAIDRILRNKTAIG
ncbi:STAS-like domain-containing protein [Methylomonas sp. 2BW1-5-20]|uniref:STAS-like domain-containing protein n=1 Tax=Methylomonas sp. 2BW1-5-20 TaxID=3376686 RepID=UPI004051059E